MKQYKPLKARQRATYAAGVVDEPRFGAIDTDHEVLHDVQITLEGEARGHGIWLDREFCEAVVEQGNATGDAGVKVRFGHPAMCSDALGTYLGRAKNFRLTEVTRKETGEKAAGVLADIWIAPESHSAPSGDLGKWVMEAAANSPDSFGQSIVFTYSDWVVKDADGARHSYNAECEEAEESSRKTHSQWRSQSADDRVYAVLGKLHGTDFTDTPAATDGVFSAGDLAAEAEEMLEEHPQIMEVLEKSPKSVVEFLERTGLAEKIESARLSGLQAAKDREIAELKATIEALHKCAAAARDTFDSAIAAEKERFNDLQRRSVEELAAKEDFYRAELESRDGDLAGLKDRVSSLESDLQSVNTALAASQDEASSLTAKLQDSVEALASAGKQLDNCRRAAAARGESVNQPPTGVQSWAEKYREARKPRAK